MEFVTALMKVEDPNVRMLLQVLWLEREPSRKIETVARFLSPIFTAVATAVLIGVIRGWF